MERSRNKSYIQQNAEKGAFMTLWGKTWGLSVYPAYSIDKVKFSFIEVGAEGKGKSFDIYVDTVRDGAQCFDNWAFDILNDRRFERVLAEEAKAGNKYPVAYKFVTGENGEKGVGICNSTAAGKYTFQGEIPGADGKKVYANVQCNFSDLRRLAENFVKSYEARREEIRNLCVEVTSQRKDSKKEEQDQSKDQSKAEKPAGNAANEKSSKQKAATETTKSAASSEVFEVRVKTLTPITQMKNGKDLAIQAITEGGETKNILFLQDVTKKIDAVRWSNFLKSTKVEGYTFKGAFSETGKGSLIFQKFTA